MRHAISDEDTDELRGDHLLCGERGSSAGCTLKLMKRKTAVMLFITALCLSLLFPPWKEEGQWRNQRTGSLATGRLKRTLDRDLFGYIPEYHPAWSHPQANQDSIGFGNQLYSRDVYHLISRKLSIDWLIFIIQIPVLALVMAAIRQGSQEIEVRGD